ncbi:hypothetical protein CHX26_12845 [Porphyrobacter sp. HT-58-2]|uniref:hypothetical protein n=1 Tax=Porphyrobacter sp. HT-58-2 TaxID=2023229 RepID=UPI000CDBEBA3|nr:hypothetical protein [Porphyrobacter sp. HT-58-2]AUX70263.1 hypothetical protein CHX26_12845 [Porphyrobacter sp. HT-58-2]
MTLIPLERPRVRSTVPWIIVSLAGVIVPALALLLLFGTPTAPAMLALAAGPVLAIGLMGAGMIAAATDGRLWVGVLLALLSGMVLSVVARTLGLLPLPDPVSATLALVIASVSFAARGALFARSAAERGWWIAVAVVAGEAAIVVTAWAKPDALPQWLLALLPAQWATTAIQMAISGSGTRGAVPALVALGGTAATTLLVAMLWPRRWPYLLMFSAWLGLSALVYHQPAPPEPIEAARTVRGS